MGLSLDPPRTPVLRRERCQVTPRRLVSAHHATVAELADAQDLGSCGATRGGSTPSGRMIEPQMTLKSLPANKKALAKRPEPRAVVEPPWQPRKRLPVYGCLGSPSSGWRAPGRDSNPHGLAASNLRDCRVYRFHHPGHPNTLVRTGS